jgi:hypothetical protein
LSCYIRAFNPFDFSSLTEYKGADINLYGTNSLVFLYNIATLFPQIADKIFIEKNIYNKFSKEYDVEKVPISVLPNLISKYANDLKLIETTGQLDRKETMGYVKSEIVKYDYTESGGTKGEFTRYDELDRVPSEISKEEKEIIFIELAIEKYDGISIEFHPSGYMTRNSIITDTIKEKHDCILQSKYGDELVVFQPNQIKLADGSNNTFDSNNPDIRFDAGGPVKNLEEKNMETKYKDGGYIVKYGKTDKAPGGNTIIRTKTELNDFIEILKQNNHPNIEVFEADSKGKPGKKVLIDEQSKNYTKRDIYNFVLKNSYLQFDGDKEDLEDDIDELTFSTRQNGDVGNEKPGQKDINQALSIKRLLEYEFKGIKTEINYVDEWVMLNIFLPDMAVEIEQELAKSPKEEVIDFYFFDRNLPDVDAEDRWMVEQALINGENLLEELENYSYEIDNDPDRLATNEIEVKTDNFTIYFFDNTTEFKFGVRYNEKLKNVVDDVATILTNLDPIPTTISGKLRPIHDIAKDIIDLVSDVNRAVETKLKSSKNEFSFDLSTYKNPYELNKAIERYLDENVKTFENAKDVVLSPEAKAFIKNYSGYGGLTKFGEISVGSMFEFFTPKKVIEKMWALAYKYGYSADGSVLETSVGTGEFLQYANPLSRVVAYEINKYSAMITQILYPFCSVNLEPFEKVFIKDNNTIGNKIESLEKFDLVIGNCPYGDFSILDAKATRYLLGFEEQKFTKAQNYIEYFLRRSIDMLNTNGLLIMIVGAEVRNGAKLFLDSPVSPVKEYLAEHSILLDAYRLPDKTFERTGVTSDIIVLRKK